MQFTPLKTCTTKSVKATYKNANELFHWMNTPAELTDLNDSLCVYYDQLNKIYKKNIKNTIALHICSAMVYIYRPTRVKYWPILVRGGSTGRGCSGGPNPPPPSTPFWKKKNFNNILSPPQGFSVLWYLVDPSPFQIPGSTSD